MKHSTLAILAAAATIAFASCEKQPVEPVNPINPTPDPAIVGGLSDQEVTFITNSEGDTTAFQITYNSWIEVDGEKLSVPLTVYHRVLDTFFYMPETNHYFPPISEGHKKSGERRDGSITIVDSVAYTLRSNEYGNSFEMECTYQVPTYDAGNTRQIMSYLRVNNIWLTNARSVDAGVDGTHYYVDQLYDCVIDVGGERHRIPARIRTYEPL